MYEARGSPFWFSTIDSTDEFPRATVSWPLVCQFRDNLFAIPPMVDRMLFPQELLGYLADPHAIDVDFFPGNLISACGITVLWAMYLKLFEAMQVEDKRGIRML